MSDPETVYARLRRLTQEAHESIASVHEQALEELNALAAQLESAQPERRSWFTPGSEPDDRWTAADE